MNIELTEVSSSNIESIGYDPSSNTMRIKFKDGGAYDYRDVSQSTYDALRTSPSIGQYFHRNIKGSYKFTKVTKEDDDE
jgi:hypothetical protein